MKFKAFSLVLRRGVLILFYLNITPCLLSDVFAMDQAPHERFLFNPGKVRFPTPSSILKVYVKKRARLTSLVVGERIKKNKNGKNRVKDLGVLDTSGLDEILGTRNPSQLTELARRYHKSLFIQSK